MPAIDDAQQKLRDFIIVTRKTLRLTQVEVARRGKVARGSLASFEAGRSSIPNQKTLWGIAKGLGVPYEQLDRIARGLPPTATIEEQARSLMERIARLSPEAQAATWETVGDLLAAQERRQGL